MKVIDFIDESIKKYGKLGDSSFEYIGLSINKGAISKQNVYRKKNDNLMNELFCKYPYKNIIERFSDLLGNGYIDVCDISAAEKNGRNTFRIIFEICNICDQSVLLDKFFSKIKNGEYYKNSLINIIKELKIKTSYESVRLFLIGIECDDECNISAIKYYIWMAEIYDDIINGNIVINEFAGFQDQRIIDICKKIKESNYRPILWGINDENGIKEHKLYFKSEAFGFQTSNIVKNTNEIMRYIGCDLVIDESITEELFIKDLFVEGIGISFEKTDMFRLYIGVLPRKQI